MTYRMRINQTFIAVTLLVGATLGFDAHAQAPTCELERPVKFGGMNWESNLMLVGVERFIVEHGYGCKTFVEQGETLPMFAALQRGDVDINTEVWITQMQEPWDRAIAAGKIKQVGTVFSGTDGLYVPRYTAEKYPDLKSVKDLAGRKDTFIDTEDPSRGRIYGCSIGWTCGTLTANLVRAFKLDDEYSVYSPGSSAAQRAAIVSAYKRNRDIVFYYWTPTSLMGSLDLVKLELPPIDERALECLGDATCADPQPTGLKPYAVATAVNTEFASRAPALIAFLSKVSVPEAALNQTLAHMETERLEVGEAATYFLKQYPDIWQQWVPADVAQRVAAKLAH